MKWYQHGFTEVPSFQELDDITGATFNEDGTYKGPNEKLDMQVVLDQRTGRKYFAPKEYDDDAINYGLAKFEENFDPKTWWGMVHDPMLSKTEQAVMTGAGIVKGAGNVLLNAPTKIVATATGLTDAVGIDAGHYLEFMAKMHPSFIATSLFRKGIKATAEDYYEAFKRIKTPKGQMGETAALYRASAKNWEDTVNKYLLPDIPENIKANYLLVNLAEMGGQVGGSLLLAAAGNTVGGLSAVAGIFGSQQFYEIREEMLEAGHSLDSANFYAALAGLAEGGIEAFGFSKWLQYATYSKSLRNIFLSSLTEGLQEGLQQTAEETLTRIAGTREADLAGLKQAFMSVAISFAAGAITGGAMSTVTGQLGIRTEKFKHEHGEKYEKGEIIKGPNAQQALELAKANKNSNPLYEAIKNVAADYKLDETTIDKIFISMYNAAKDIKTQEELFAGIARQCVAYKGILNKTPRDIDEENKKAANAINRHLSQEAADKFHADVVNALKARGVDEAKANVQAKVPDMVFKNLSERLGVNLQEFKPVQITAVPANEEYYAGKEDMQEGAPSMDYKGEVPFQDRTNETDKEIAAVQRQIDALDKMHGKPKTNLLSTLRKTGVDYKNTRLDPQKLKELHIKNVPVSKGGLGAEGYEYLVKHGFMPGAEQGDQLTYEDSRELDGAADDMLERAIAGEAVYRMDDAEQVARANEAEGYKAQLEEEKDRLLAEKGKRGYIEIGETVNKIVLGKTADASTLQHELVHHWRNVIETLAARGNKAAQALKAQMDAIIEKHKDEVKQDINKEEEVLSEAFEKWLYLGGHGNTDGEIKLFRAMQQFFKDIYDGVRSITGVRIDPEIDSFFKQITGLEPIQIQRNNQADSIYQRTDKSKYMTDNEVKAANEDYQAFKAQFASMQAGKMPSADSFTLSRSLPSAYNKIPELKGKRLVMSQSIFKKIINLKNKYGKNHNLDYKRAEKLPLYIADPLYITRSKVQEHEDRFIIITGSRGVGDGVRLSVVVQPSKNVVVVSAYDEVVNISEEKKAKRLVYDKKDELLKTNATSKAAPISNSNSSIANQTGIVKAQKLFQDDKDRAFQYSLFKAEEMGEKVADSRPSKEQVAKDVAAIHNGDLSRSQRQESFWDSVGSFFGNTLLSVRQRAGSVSPKLKALFDKLDFWEVNYERKYADPSKAFIRKFRALEPADRAELDYYIYNRCEEELRAFLKAHNMEKEYNDVRDMLDELFATGNMHGIDMNFMHEYFPTFMANYEGFVSYMLQTDKWTYIDKALKEIDPQNVMSNEEKADYINKLVRGRVPDLAKKPAAAKAREILYKDPNIMKFYAPSDEALQRYVSAMSRAIATHRAFGMGKNSTNSEETVGAIVRELIESKTIDVKEEKLIRHLLKSRLTYQPTPHFVRWMKNVGYLTSMNNITSAITQIGDLYAAFYKYGFSTGWEATFGKREIKMDELGLDDIWEEFKDDKGTALWVRKVFKAVGLSYLDKIGKETAINASLINLRKQAANGNMELSARLAHTFGKDAGRVLADIKAGKITEEIKLLTFCDLADTQPIGQSGVPTGYLNNPTARLFYQLKTFTLGQISLAYADGILNIQNGYKYKNWAQFRKGWQKLFSLAVLLTVANAGADVIKNLVMGRKIDISDTVISNLLWNVGVSKYTFFRGKREGYATSLFYNYMGFPLMSGTDDAVRDIIRTSTGRQELRDTKLVQYIPYGRAYYWWFGGGSESGQARTAKRRKVAAKHNRKKKR